MRPHVPDFLGGLHFAMRPHFPLFQAARSTPPARFAAAYLVFPLVIGILENGTKLIERSAADAGS